MVISGISEEKMVHRQPILAHCSFLIYFLLSPQIFVTYAHKITFTTQKYSTQLFEVETEMQNLRFPW
jgi:hypothetical protein